MITTKFILGNLNCAACGKVSQLKIGKIPGVTSLELEQVGGQATGTLTADREISLHDIEVALQGTGYTVSSL